MISGRAPSCRDRTWMKWMSTPSISVLNCGSAFSLASQARQSYSVAQKRASAWIVASWTPCDRSSTSSLEGQRVAARWRRSSASCSSGTSIRNGRTVCASSVTDMTALPCSLAARSLVARAARRARGTPWPAPPAPLLRVRPPDSIRPMTRLRLTVSALGAAIRNEDLRRVELAWGASIAAEWAHFVALGVFAYERGGAAAVGLAGLVRLLPAALLAPFAAALGDRFRRERFLVAILLVGSAALAASAAAALADQRVPVLVFAALIGISSTLVRPALQALLPSLTRTPEELLASNGATSTVEGLGTLAGPLLAGALVALADVSVVFIAGAAVLLMAAALLGRVSVEGRDALAPVRDRASPRQMVVAGFQAVARAPGPRLLVGLFVAQAFVRGCLNVLIVVLVFQGLGRSGADVGYLTAAVGGGGLVGAIAAMGL